MLVLPVKSVFQIAFLQDSLLFNGVFMPVLKTITLPEIQKMFKQHAGIKLSRPSIYNYIKNKGFPPSLSMGSPRVWLRASVAAWFEEKFPSK